MRQYHDLLRLILELKQVGRPFVLALNMFDIAQKQGLRIDLEGLSKELGVPVLDEDGLRAWLAGEGGGVGLT